MTVRREKVIGWGLLAVALLISALATRDAGQRLGQTNPGFGVMDSLLVAVGGLDLGPLQPFDLVRAVNGQLVTSGRELQAEVRRHPPGTALHYLVNRRGQLVEVDVPSQRLSVRHWHQYLSEGLLPSLLFLALGAIVLYLKPGAPETRLFLAFCLNWFAIAGLYSDAHFTYRFTPLFLTAFAFSPAIFIHMALTFPERRAVLGRRPWLAGLPYALAAALAAALNLPGARVPVKWLFTVPAISAAFWGVSLVLLILALLRTSRTGKSPLIRQRARVLATGFAVGQLVPVLGTAYEAIFRSQVPYLNELWRLNILFPMTVAYAMVRYNLFDLRTVIRTGAVYAVVTGLVVLAYAGGITLVNVTFADLGPGRSPFVPAAVVAVAVVLFLNPVYRRTQAVVDRLFFRQRLDVQQSLERVSDAMTTLLDLSRITQLITGTVDDLFKPTRRALLVLDEAGGAYRPAVDAPGLPPAIPKEAPLLAALAQRGIPISRERLQEEPELAGIREAGLARMDAVGVDLLVPVFFHDRMTAFLALGPKRSGLAYTTEDLRVLRLLGNQSAVALENAKTYTALEKAHLELQSALRRVQILESIRANLAKFVPRTVQTLIEQAPEAPEFEKREVDVSVLFVDIAGYTRLSQRFDLERVNELVERYFGSFLDEILRHGGDVNETAGDGLMVIFRDDEPQRHARAAVQTAAAILRRAQQINAELAPAFEPIRLHVGVNSGIAAVGATKIEGGAGTRWVYTASGPVTNLAARLAALGEGDVIFIGAETRGRLEEGWMVEDLGERVLRNVEEPVRVFQLAVTLEVPAAPSLLARS